MESANRKLIRPSLNEIKEQIAPPRRPQKKPVPPDQTNAENFYYVKQMQSKTPMVFVLKDGETLHGVIEWYDKCCLKVNRTGEPNCCSTSRTSSTCIRRSGGRLAHAYARYRVSRIASRYARLSPASR